MRMHRPVRRRLLRPRLQHHRARDRRPLALEHAEHREQRDDGRVVPAVHAEALRPRDGEAADDGIVDGAVASLRSHELHHRVRLVRELPEQPPSRQRRRLGRRGPVHVPRLRRRADEREVLRAHPGRQRQPVVRPRLQRFPHRRRGRRLRVREQVLRDVRVRGVGPFEMMRVLLVLLALRALGDGRGRGLAGAAAELRRRRRRRRTRRKITRRPPPRLRRRSARRTCTTSRGRTTSRRRWRLGSTTRRRRPRDGRASRAESRCGGTCASRRVCRTKASATSRCACGG
mmetsp:Transcript_2783/g.8974  ORF Transcript_2783/g.8974 Transcript_2783/m.8974 type:complete len:287 (-) Transcript_2783:306-1166(-)